MAQEVNIGSDAIEYAKLQSIAEKELEAMPYLRITFYRKNDQGESIKIFMYDIPRDLLERWSWVIKWRRAKLICMYPRGEVYDTIYFYYRYKGKDYGFTECLKQLVALKSKITLQENRIKKYIDSKKHDLFFDESTDEQLVKIRKKLVLAKEKVLEATRRLEEKVEKHKQEQS